MRKEGREGGRVRRKGRRWKVKRKGRRERKERKKVDGKVSEDDIMFRLPESASDDTTIIQTK